MTIMSSHKPQSIWERPSSLIRSSAVRSGMAVGSSAIVGVLGRVEARGEEGGEGNLRVLVCVFMAEDWRQREINGVRKRFTKRQRGLVQCSVSCLPAH